ncbi:MAG: nickel pincer cofactor biosynthesis protein LarC [Abitibacteriaceae bacterium]|nr:nickel pincer cofactor biosynthesis protein LarC [Abditibacteriaceae bacterium]
MALGALLDCGVPLAALREGLASLPVSGWQIEAQPILQNGIHGMDVSISLNGLTDAQELQQASHEAVSQGEHKGHSHHHEPHHDHEHGQDNHHSHDHHNHEHEHYTHAPDAITTVPHVHGRSFSEIRAIIESSQLSDRVRRDSLAIFQRIAEAEAHIHHTTPEEIHFHEIGGIDSLLDICGVAWCLEYLGVDKVHCSALPHSTSFVNCAHGLMPVPAPATLELMKGVPLVPTEIRGEMVTPTGAGIVAALSQSFGSPPAMTPQRIGLGSGKKRFADRPNLLRVVIGQTATVTQQQAAAVTSAPTQPAITADAALAGLEWQSLAVIESNIDNMNPEFFQYVLERLFEAGAVDVWIQPLQMKKNRPASLLGALCPLEAQPAVIATMLRETTTLGVRVQEVSRAALPRKIKEVETKFGTVHVKIASWPERHLWRATPEYADVEHLAAQHKVPLREVYEAALASAQRAADGELS